METKRLLVIDDSSAFREAIVLAGRDRGWEVCASHELDRINAWLAERLPDVVLLDWRLAGQQRRKYAELLRDKGLTQRTLLLSGGMDDGRGVFAREYNLAGIRLKPLDLGRLEEEIQLEEEVRLPEHLPTREFIAKNLRQLRDIVDKVSPALVLMDKNLHTLWSNKGAKEEPPTPEQYLITKWLRAEIAEDNTRSVARRMDWDGVKNRFLESRLYSIDSGNYYALERDWRAENERPHDHEFFNLEERNPTVESWLQAVARLLAQRYAISRFRVYKISPLPHTPGLEEEHPPLVQPKFQSGGGIEPDADSWLRTGFAPKEISHIGNALGSDYILARRLSNSTEDQNTESAIPRVQYEETGTHRILFPVRHPDTRQPVALLAMDRRLEHAEGLDGFDRAVVDIAMRMASDQAGVLSERQWSLMKGLVEDIGRRIISWLEEDEKDRVAKWQKFIAKEFIRTFSDTKSSPEMIYEGISQICAALAQEWNKEKISGRILGTTPRSEQEKKGASLSSWSIAIAADQQDWQAVAGWGMAYRECRRNGGRISNVPPDIAHKDKAWKAAVIQDFQAWSEKATARGISFECLNDETRERIGSSLVVPMQVEGRIRALMLVHSPHVCYFTQFHTELMEYAAERLLPLLAAALRETRTRNAFTAAVMHEVKNESHAARMLLNQVQREAAGTQWANSLIEIRHYLDELNALGQDTLDIFRVGTDSGKRANQGKEESITAPLGSLIDSAVLGWRTLYEDTEFELRLPKDLGACKIAIAHGLTFKRVLRVLLHNAFRHGLDWVRIGARLDGEANSDGRLALTITNPSYHDIISNLAQGSASAVDRPSASPLIRGRLGLVVARQLTTEAAGTLSELQYTDGNPGRAEITLTWPVHIIP